MYKTTLCGNDPFLSAMPALKQNIIMANPLGLHARPAAQLAQTAQMAHGAVYIYANNRKADAKEVLEILSLGCGRNGRLIIEVEDPQDSAVLKKMCDQLSGETPI